MSDYPSRVQRMYEQYAPEKQGNVPTILAKFQGKEDELLATLVTKYGPEPNAASPAKQGAKAPPGKKAPPPAGSGGAAPKPASSPKRVDDAAAASSEHQPSTLAPVPRQGGDNNGFNAGPNPLLDPLYSLRNQVRTQIGFLTKEHELMWEDAWMGKMPLGTLRKTWDVKQSVLMAGQGWKMSSHARPVKRWQKRYFVLAPPFLYYFSNDSPSCICKGALYLDRATIEEDIVKEKSAIIITSRVTKKPPVLNQGFLAKFGQSKSSEGSGGGGGGSGGGEGAGDMNSFTINFDSEREQATWLDLMKKVVKLGDVGLSGKTYGDYPANPMHMMMQQMMAGGGGGANGGRGGGMMMDPNAMASNPMFAQMMQQQQMQQGMMNGGAASSSRSPQQQQGGMNNNNNNNNPYSWMMGFNNYNVDAPEIKRRIVRLASHRDPILMADVFLQFIQDHMENAPILWKLMASLEEIEPYTGPTFQMNGMMGGPYGGAGGGMGMGMIGGGGQYPGGGSMVGMGGGGNMRNQQYPNQMMNTNASGMNSSFGGGGHLQQQQQQEAGGLAPSSSSGNPVPTSSPEELDRVSLASLHEQFNQSGGQSALMRASGRGYARDATPEEMDWSITNGQRSQQQHQQQQQPHSNMSHHSSSYGGDDAEWQQRISRIRDRKHLVDRLVQDLPE